MDSSLKILFIGDIVGRPGRRAIKELLPGLIVRYSPDLVIANGENSAGGFGITPSIYDELRELHVDVVTSGNHIWDRKEVCSFINDADYLLRPANYPSGVPGKGWLVFECASGVRVGVVNLSGRVFMDEMDCPFRVGREIVEELGRITPVIVVDMHAETTSEKMAVGWFLDGRVSAVVGTHTHVQTADERVLPGGTAFITDTGMTGPVDSVIGIKKELVLERFLTRMPVRFDVAGGRTELQGVVIRIDPANGRAQGIERIREVLR